MKIRPTSFTPGRLTKRAEFLAVRRGEKRRGRFFLLEVARREDNGLPRVGFTVTTRQGNAVERNRIRRRLKEALRLKGRMAMRAGHDYVIVGRKECLHAPFSELCDELVLRIGGKRFHG